MKRPVTIRLTSRSGAATVRREYAAERYAKGGAEYYRYRETDPEMGDTTTVIRIGDNDLRVIRFGDIRSEQVFVPNKRTAGYYETKQGRLALETVTNRLSVRLANGTGSVSWTYDLYMSGAAAGTFSLELKIK